MIRWLLLAVVIGLISFAGSLAYRLGAFKSPEFTIAEEPEIHVLYKIHLGPYHKIVGTIEEVEVWAKTHQIPCTRSFGEFLDSPEIVDESRLRANCGCVLESIPVDLAGKIPPDFKLETKSAQKYIKVIFDGSPSIGPMKVYDQVKQMAAAQRMRLGDSNLEIYKITETGMITTYLFPIRTN
jgi:effector-binding domain-containing protein